MTYVGHLQEIGEELDGLGDRVTDKTITVQELIDNIGILKTECQHNRLTFKLANLQGQIMAAEQDEVWQIIRNFTEDMPCDCASCLNELQKMIENQDYKNAEEMIHELRYDIY